MSSHHIRSAESRDYPAYARLFLELGVPDPVPAQDTWDATYSKRAIVLELDGAVTGYGIWSAYGELGHVMNVVVDPTCRGRRLGEALMLEMAARLRTQGCTRWMLNVKESNASAIRLYERLGFRTKARSYATSIPWAAVERMTASSEFSARTLPPEEEAVAEKHFGLAEGAISKRRAISPANIVVAAFGPDGAMEGVALFVPSMGGVSPLRVKRVEALPTLLKAISPARLPEPDYCRIFVEDNEALYQAVVEAGGSLFFGILQMAGEFPSNALSEGDLLRPVASSH